MATSNPPSTGDLARGYDVIVVGSGAGGGTLAYGLAERGARVLLVERGEVARPPARADGPPDRVGFAQAEYEAGASFVGGPTKFYGSALYRLRQQDFARTQLETGDSPEWPISYDELEPYYGEAERVYAVHGDGDGDPTEPPRTTPYPYPPIPHQGVIRSMVERIEATGQRVCHIPRGLDVRPGGRCVLCATCDGYYCRLDAKMDSEIACVRPAIATGRVHLATGTECLRVLMSPDGKRAIGASIRRGSVESTVHAAAVAVSAGLLETPLLLRRSRTDRHPHGVGNQNGCLGRYMCGHTVDMLLLVMGIGALAPVHSKTFAIHSFYAPSKDWPYPQGVIQMAGQLPPHGQPAHVRALLSRSFVVMCMSEEPALRRCGIDFVGDGMNPQVIRPPVCDKSLTRLRKTAARIFRDAGCKIVVPAPVRNQGWHGVGTARMGTDEATSVVDPSCRVHDVENLYVVDSSSLPSPGAVNTGLTLMALALRAAKHIAATTH